MFTPDYRNLEKAALNRETARTPLYDHKISTSIMERIENRSFNEQDTTDAGMDAFFANYDNFFLKMGYDTVTFEQCITRVLPGGGALAGQVDPVIKTRDDFNKYPFEDVPRLYVERFGKSFRYLVKNFPAGMKAVGGVGNGVFEIAQDLVGYENLMLLSYDDPELYADIFAKIGDTMLSIWSWFLKLYANDFAVVRMGDDLGYKSNTMLPHDDIRAHIIPQYKRLVDLAHSYNKPFLLHSCGCIFEVMDDIISVAGINAKHSNEDQIAEFKVWVDRYGDRIGNFGGIDTDHLVRMDETSLKKLVVETMRYCGKGHGGFALGSGNSIPDYVDPAKFLAMNQAVREERGDFKD